MPVEETANANNTNDEAGLSPTGLPVSPWTPTSRMLTLPELCSWLNITERHARKLVERNAIPYRKVGRLLRFCETDVENWSRSDPLPRGRNGTDRSASVTDSPTPRSPRTRRRATPLLPKSLLD
jgi:excisionase family DNA binding protein